MLTAIIVALLGSLGVIGAASIPVMLQQRAKVNEAHRMLTVNHHSSAARGEEPTVLDRMDDIKQLLLEHIKHSEGQDRRLERLEDYVYKD